MLFSKSFDYALRGVLYVTIMSDTKKKIRIEEISAKLLAPRHFLGKIMNKVVKKGILDSTKGPFGGLSINDKTMDTTLLLLVRTVDGLHPFNSCVLKMKKCNASQPCPLHEKMAHIRDHFYEVFANTTIGELKNNKQRSGLLKSISVY